MCSSDLFVWVLGNHDPTPPEGLPGEWVPELRLGPLRFRHEASAGAAPGEVVGHHHPKATVDARGGAVSRPCFVVGGDRVMMPAFGAYTGGLDVASPAIATVFPRGGRVFLLGKDRLYSFGLDAARRAPPPAPQGQPDLFAPVRESRGGPRGHQPGPSGIRLYGAGGRGAPA